MLEVARLLLVNQAENFRSDQSLCLLLFWLVKRHDVACGVSWLDWVYPST